MLSSVVLMFVTLYRMVISQINKSRKKSWKKKKGGIFHSPIGAPPPRRHLWSEPRWPPHSPIGNRKMQTFSLNKRRQTRSEMLLCDFQNILTKKKEKKKSLFTGSFNILWSASLEAMLLSSFFLQRILLWRTGLTAEQLLSTVAVQSASLEEKQTNNFRIYANLSDWLSTYFFIN